MTNTIVIATNNAGKAREFRAIFEPKGLQVKTLADFPTLDQVAETGQTFTENATLKATAVAQATQLPVLADDSGLMVDALNGAPGIYSARYAGITMMLRITRNCWQSYMMFPPRSAGRLFTRHSC